MPLFKPIGWWKNKEKDEKCERYKNRRFRKGINQMFKCFHNYTGVEMPPSLRIRQKWTAIKIIIIKGSPMQ